VNFELGADEEALIDSVRRALTGTRTLEMARGGLDGEPLADLWPLVRKGGWQDMPGLLYGALVLVECGRVLAPTGLLGHLTARAAVSTLDPDVRAVFVPLDRTYVPDAPGAEVFVAQTADGLILAEATVTPAGGYDASRPLGDVTIHSGQPVDGDAGYAWNVAQTLLAAEALGAAEAALDLAVAYAKERKAFGRAIGSFQAIKHQLTDGLRLNENARSLLYYACYAATSAPGEFGLAANTARFAADQAIDTVTRRCIAVHGGMGATWEHDAHLYFRRAQLTRLLLGGQAGAGERVVSHVLPD
jgi:alkylation response protein AidB-like acyl-CoA dehydrogenase